MKFSKFLLFVLSIFVGLPQALAEKTPTNLQVENLAAWCIVPFDAMKRGPVERAEMLKELGIRRCAYDWREEHVSEFEEEIKQYLLHDIDFFAFWGGHEKAFSLFEKYDIHPQIWQMMGSPATGSQEEKIEEAANALVGIAKRTAELGCKLAIYNHGGWGGEPENMVAVCKKLQEKGYPHVGIVYNWHHGHGHIEDWAESLALMKPYLHCLNLNGMNADENPKILPLAQGEYELAMLKIVTKSGYTGPIGILDHQDHLDAKENLQDNLNGLEWLKKELMKPGSGGAKPIPKAKAIVALTPNNPSTESHPDGKFGKALNASAGGVVVPGKEEFRTLPLSIECWAKLNSTARFNILAASDTKASGEHWELYTYTGSGDLSLYLPGRGGNFKASAPVCDDRWHHLAAIITEDSVQLFVDGKQVLEKGTTPLQGHKMPGDFAIGRLVEGGIACDGLIDDVRVSSGRRDFSKIPTSALERDEFTIRLWSLDKAEAPAADAENEPGSFTPKGGPAAEKKKSLISQHPFNVERLYHFYPQEAEHFLSPKEQPDILPAFPGIDGGSFGHWGKRNDVDWRDGSWNEMDLGPVFAGVLHGLGKPIPKAVAARLGKDGGTSVCFDPLTGGLHGAWSGGFVKFDEGRFGFLGGIRPEGTILFNADNSAGWDSESIKFTGTFRSGLRTVFSYQIGSTVVLDHPWLENGSLVRMLEFETAADQTLRLFPATAKLEILHDAAIRVGGITLSWTITGDGSKITPLVEGGMVKLKLEKAEQLVLRFEFGGTAKPAAPTLVDLEQSIQDGEALWPDVLITEGRLGEDDGAYVIDTLTVPYENPWKAPFYLAGNDFFEDGRAAVCTIDGDVWIVTGIDEKLARLEWRRFATGLHQPLGLVIRDERIYVLGRDQITILNDRDNNGEADYYENFTNRYVSSSGGHDFITGLERDAVGNLYFASANQGICKVSPDGSSIEIISTGVRNPNGLGVSSSGKIAVSPQEGDWTPASMICFPEPGRHFGYGGPRDGRVDPPVCFIPRGIDHATGGHVFAESSRFGPLGGHLLTLSWGNCQALLTLTETIAGIEQAAVVPIEGEFLSGIHRGRMNPHDGQLYLTGATGWGTYATQNGCFQRLRYTGKAACLPISFNAHRNGVLIEFSDPLDPQSINLEDVFAQQWNYNYSRAYGSPELSVTRPDTPGHDRVKITKVEVLEGGRKLFLEIPDIAPVDQLHLFIKLRTAAGETVHRNLFATIHRLGPVFDAYPGFISNHRFQTSATDLRRAATAGTRKLAPTPSNFVKRPIDPALAGRKITIQCISGLAYDTKKFLVQPGEKISLTVENSDVIPHNLVIATPDSKAAVGERAALMLTKPGALDRQYVPDMPEVIFHTLVLDPGQSDTLYFQAPELPGDYPFLCTFPGHWMIMNGIMQVGHQPEPLPQK